MQGLALVGCRGFIRRMIFDLRFGEFLDSGFTAYRV